MTTYFTYHIYHSITAKHYYGARWKPGCDPSDLWTNYFTSSTKVHKLIEDYGKDSFKVEIRKTFTTMTDCMNWEFNVLRRLKVKSNDNWLNVAIGKPTMLGRKHSPETIEKMRKPKGPWSEARKKAKSLDELEKVRNGKVMPYTGGMTWTLRKITCPHCNKIGALNLMKRYHFDNCKSITNS